MSEQVSTVTKKDGSEVRLAAIRSTLLRGFQEPIEAEIPPGQTSMMSLLFPVFDSEEVES